jgi:predicted metal-dependent hydrolase
MKKSERLRAFVDSLPKAATPGDLDPRYTGYFTCFNSGQYYEAHDVLEDLWLGGERGPDYAFFKGLIQFAGAFVHLQKQAARPDHPKDGRRLRPAVRLFALAKTNLASFRPEHMRLDVDRVLELAERHVDSIVASDYTQNPWHPETAPRLTLA